MKVTGYTLREAIKRWELRRDTAATQFTKALNKFDGEIKASPDDVMKDFNRAEDALSSLQTAQAAYNLANRVQVQAKVMTLGEAVKRIGGAGRAEKMWRVAAAGKKDRYGSNDAETVRNKDEIRAIAVVSTNHAMTCAHEAAKFASALREAIGVGNAQALEIESLFPALFE